MKRPDFYFAAHPLGKEWLIGTQELADYFKVSTRTIAAYREKGLIPHWKLNARLIRYDLAAVETALGNRLTNDFF
jgi:phage terminase Nu1 subunit (DNA packaging protein)